MSTIAQGAPLSGLGPAQRQASRKAERAAADTLLCLLLALYLLTLAFEGPLRWALVSSGLPDALYVRDAIPVASLLFLFARSLFARGRLDLVIAVPAALVALHAAYALVMGLPWFQVAFGIKIFMFIPYGMAMWPLVRRRWRAAMAFMAGVFAATLVGVFANFAAGTLPWEGIEYRTAFGAVSTTRTWWIPGGISRLPGFTRTSFDAAMILGITGLLAMARTRHVLVQLAIAAAALAAIVLTTSKGMILAFPVAALWLMLSGDRLRGGAVLAGVLCAVTLVLPPLIVFTGLGSAIDGDSFPPLVLSVWERFTMMWPGAFDLMPHNAAAILGGGPGAIGTPQTYGDAPHLLNAADNMAVFMFVSLGLPGALYYALPAFAAPRIVLAERPEIARAWVAMLVIAYGYGMSISMVEESFFCIVFGLCTGAAVSALAACGHPHGRRA